MTIPSGPTRAPATTSTSSPAPGRRSRAGCRLKKRLQGCNVTVAGKVSHSMAPLSGGVGDSDVVLLLRPAWPGSAIPMRGRMRAAGAQRHTLPGLVAATVFALHGSAPPELLRWCRERLSSRPPQVHRLVPTARSAIHL